jgi:FlaA1/EpsC-like NDP-sugar epimerase
MRLSPSTSLTQSVNVRRIGQVVIDAGLVALAYYLAYHLRFDTGFPHRYQRLLGDTILFAVFLKVGIFALFGLYSKLWRFVDQKDFESIVKAVVVASVVLVVGLFLLPPGKTDPPRGVIALDFLITLALVSGSRFLVRALVGATPSSAAPRSASWTTTPESRGCGSPASRCWERRTSSPGCSMTPSRTR